MSTPIDDEPGHDDSSQDVDSSPSFSSSLNRLHDTRNPRSRRPDDCAWNHTIDLQTGQSIWEPSQDDCQTPHRPLEKTHVKVEPSDIDQTDSPRSGAQRYRPRSHLQQATVRCEDHDLKNGTTWLTTAQDRNVTKAQIVERGTEFILEENGADERACSDYFGFAVMFKPTTNHLWSKLSVLIPVKVR